MPYKANEDGSFKATGKMADWVVEFEKWYSEDFGSKPPINMGDYGNFLTISIALRAQEKWQNGIFSKSKAKTIESMVTIHPNGVRTLNNVYQTLDFLAENLSNEDRNNWSQDFRTKIIKQFKN